MLKRLLRPPNPWRRRTFSVHLSTPNLTGQRFHRTMEWSPPAPGSLKALLLPPLLNKVRNKGAQGVQARYGAELHPFISLVRYPGRLVILGMESLLRSRPSKPNQRKGQNGKFMNFALFGEFWCFSLGKQARFPLNFCSGMPLAKSSWTDLSLVWFARATPDLHLHR